MHASWRRDSETLPTPTGPQVLRVTRLVRLGKLLKKFPDIWKQIKAIGKSISAVGALMTLIILFMFIFMILGMNIFGGILTMEYDAGELARGANVFVELPADTSRDKRPRTMPGRRGVIIDVDAENRAQMPWQVCFSLSVSANDFQQMGLDKDGCVWASDDSEARIINETVITTPVITGIVPRLHYDNIYYSFITTFQILTTANWNDNMHDAAAARGRAPPYPTAPNRAAALYFYVIIIVGNYVLLNMFIAIIIQKFAEQRLEAVDAGLKKMKQNFIDKFGTMTRDEFTETLMSMFRAADADGSGLIEKRELQDILRKDVNLDLPEREFTRLYKKYDEDGSGEIDVQEFVSMMNELLQEAKNQLGQVPTKQWNDMTPRTQELKDSKRIEAFQDKLEAEIKAAEQVVIYSLYCLAPTNPLRAACTALTTNVWFDRLVLFCIGYSSVTLALDAPLMSNTDPMRNFLSVSDYIMNAVFIVECVGKIISKTFRTYIADAWCKLDAFIVFFAVLDMIVSAVSSGASLGPLKTIRILRALRPLRLIARAEGLRTMINAMFSSVKPIISTCCIALGTYSLLGLIGMQLLLGKMGTCTDNKIKFMRDCWGPNDDGELRQWYQPAANFNALPQAVSTLFTLASQDGWPVYMFQGVDSRGPIMQPEGSKYAGNVEMESAKQNAMPELFLYYFFSIMVRYFPCLIRTSH
jgi:hypothetical protein